MKELLLGDSLISQFIQVVPIALVIGVAYFISRNIYLKRKKIKVYYKRELLYLIFVCYMVGLLSLVLVPSNFWHRIWHFIVYGYSENPFDGIFNFEYNLIPILYKVAIGEYFLGNWIKTMIIGNVLMFVSMGILLPLCFEKINSKNIYMYAVLVPLVIEVIQLAIGRSFDIDDLIMNCLGILIGYFIVAIMRRLLSSRN